MSEQIASWRYLHDLNEKLHFNSRTHGCCCTDGCKGFETTWADVRGNVRANGYRSAWAAVQACHKYAQNKQDALNAIARFEGKS